MTKRFVLVTLILSWLMGIGFSANAEPLAFTELENNNERSAPEVLCMNAVINGTLSYEDQEDTDCYRICVPANGEISISFQHDYFDTSKKYCKIRLYPAHGDSALWGATVAGNATELNYDAFYLGQGEYDLVVTGEQRTASNYQLMVKFNEAPTGESEYNDSPEAADEMQVNQSHLGALSYEGDIDYYHLKLDAPGEVSLGFSHEYFDHGDAHYKLILTKGIGGQTIRSIKFSGKDSDSLSNAFFLDAGDYYIRIEDDYRWTTIPYAFQMNYTPNDHIELEGNDSFDTATDIPLNTAIKGALSSDGDRDVYRFTLDAPGEIGLSHTHEYFDNGDTHYSISLYNGIGADTFMFSDSLSGKDSDWHRWAVYLPAGEYYLQYEDGYRWSTRPYEFTLNYTALSEIESERNDSFKNSTPIQPNIAYKGSLMNDKDIDYYTFTLDQLSKIEVAFDFEYFDNGDTYFGLDLYTDTRSDSCYYSRELSGKDNALTSYSFYLPAGTYYVAVDKGYRHTARPYAISIAATPCTDAELEWNNSYATATPIELGQAMKGSLRYKEDIDYYRLDIAEACSIQVSFQHEWFDYDDTFYKVFLDGQANDSQRMMELSLSGRDSDFQTNEAMELQPGTYYLSVKAGYGYRHSAIPYVITVR